MLDFPEEEVDSLHRDDAAARLARVRAALEELLAKSRQGSLLRSGIHVVLAGRPNVGKSSLLNRLAGEERAIVTPMPGTTRDALREPIQIEGVPLVVVDTAGLRASDDVSSASAWSARRRELERADLVLGRARGREAPATALEGLPAAVSRIDVYNKIDLAPGFRPPAGASRVARRVGEERRRHRSVAPGDARGRGLGVAGESVFLARERHLRALRGGAAPISKRRRANCSGRSCLPRSCGLRIRRLGGVTGEFTADDLLGEIFARFCIGK